MSSTRGPDGVDPSGDREPLIDIERLAKWLGVTSRHVRRLVSDRRVPSIMVGGRVRFDPIEIRKWIDGRRRPLTDDR